MHRLFVVFPPSESRIAPELASGFDSRFDKERR